MHRNLVALDDALGGFLRSENGEDCISAEDIGIVLKSYLKGDDHIEIKVNCQSHETQTVCYETPFSLPLDEVKHCIAFFAEKLYFDESEKKAILSNKEGYNEFIKLSEECQDIEKQINAKLEKLQEKVTKKISYEEFEKNPVEFLKDFLHLQNQSIKTLKSNSQSMLKKRNWHDQNDFLQTLLENYEEILYREIKRVISFSGTN